MNRRDAHEEDQDQGERYSDLKDKAGGNRTINEAFPDMVRHSSPSPQHTHCPPACTLKQILKVLHLQLALESADTNLDLCWLRSGQLVPVPGSLDLARCRTTVSD